MLTRASVLNLAWHARNREIPVIGGDPVLERDSAGYVRGQANILRSLPRLDPRFELVKPNGSSLFSPAMLLECARVNRMTLSRDYASWTPTTASVTAGQPDARGGAGASLINATGAGGSVSRAVTVVGNGTKAVAVIARPGAGAPVSAFGIYSFTASVWRGAVSVTWNGSAPPTLGTHAGTVTSSYAVQLSASSWLIVGIIPSVVASDTNLGYFLPAGSGSGSAYCDHFQVEDGDFFTSVIDSGAAAGIRTVDKFRWNAGPSVGNVLVYGEYIYGGDKSVAPYRFVRGSAAGAYLAVFQNPDDSMRLFLHNGVGSTTLITSPIGAVWNDRIDYAALILADRSARLIARVNKLDVFDDDAAAGATVTHAAFTTEDTWLNGYDTSNVGASRYTKLLAVNPSDMVSDALTGDAQTVMAELDLFSDKLFFGETI